MIFMETYNLTKDMRLLCQQATSFPAGIETAFKELEKKIGGRDGRTFFGISRGSKDGIEYKAAVLESFEGEAEKLGLETYIVKKGEYKTETIMNWMQNIPKMGQAFQELCADPNLDRNSYCVEWYKGETEVMCMVRLEK
jgi:hypothetical protein